MKKLSAILLALALLCFPAISVSAAAPTLAASPVNATPGESFALVLRIENNPGFCYLKVNFSFDPDLLMLENVSNGTVSADSFTVTEKALQWDSDADAAASGDLAVFRFTAKKAGTATVTFKVVGCYNYNEETVSLSGTTAKVTVVPPHVHDFGEWEAYNDKLHRRVCKSDPSHVDYAEHVWDEGKLSDAPGCTAAGKRTYTCTVCKATKSETVAALGHLPKSVPGKAATCTADGLTDGVVCSRCGDILTAQTTMPAKGHTFGAWTVTKAPTCVDKGEETRTCSVCKTSETRELAATGVHSFGRWTVKTPATAEKEGLEVRACTVCGKEEMRTVPKLGPEEKVRLGDVDFNGSITAADARLALRRAVELEDYAPGSKAFIACDVDRSGGVTAADARLILRAAVELEDPAKW